MGAAQKHVRDIKIALLFDGFAAFPRDFHDTALEALRPVSEISTVARMFAALEQF